MSDQSRLVHGTKSALDTAFNEATASLNRAQDLEHQLEDLRQLTSEFQDLPEDRLTNMNHEVLSQLFRMAYAAASNIEEANATLESMSTWLSETRVLLERIETHAL